MELESAHYKYISDESTCNERRRRSSSSSSSSSSSRMNLRVSAATEYFGVPFRWEESPGRPIITDPKKNIPLKLDQKDYESSPDINHNIMKLTWTACPNASDSALNLPPKLQYQHNNCYHNYNYNSQLSYHNSDSNPMKHLDTNLNRPQSLDESKLNRPQLGHTLIMSPRRSNMLNERNLKSHSSKIKCSGYKYHHHHQNILQIPLNPSLGRINGIDDDKAHGVYHDRFFFNGKLSTSLDMKLMRCFHVSSILDSWNLINDTYNDHDHDHNDTHDDGESNLQCSHHGQLESSLLMMDRDYDNDDQYAPPSPWILGFSPNITSNTNHHDNVSCMNIMGMMKKNKNKVKMFKNEKNQMLTNHHSYMKITNKVLRLATLVKMKSMLGKLIATSSGKGRNMKSSTPWYGQGHDHNNIWSPTLATYLYNQQKELLVTTFKAHGPEELKVSKSNVEPHTRCGKNLGYAKSSPDTNGDHILAPSFKSHSGDIEVPTSKTHAETKPSNGDPTLGNPLHQSPETVLTKPKTNGECDYNVPLNDLFQKINADTKSHIIDGEHALNKLVENVETKSNDVEYCYNIESSYIYWK